MRAKPPVGMAGGGTFQTPARGATLNVPLWSRNSVPAAPALAHHRAMLALRSIGSTGSPPEAAFREIVGAWLEGFSPLQGDVTEKERERERERGGERERGRECVQKSMAQILIVLALSPLYALPSMVLSTWTQA